MKIYGYERCEEMSDDESLLELKEATIDCTYDELEKIASFIEYALEEWRKLGETYAHVHYCDWDKRWNKNSSDFIISRRDEDGMNSEDVVNSELEHVEYKLPVRVFPYDSSLDPIIYAHEVFMHEKYENLLKEYREEFSKYGYELEGALYWNEFMYWQNVSAERIPYKNGYECFFKVNVKKDGAFVRYDAGDDTLLGDSISFSSISLDEEELIVRLFEWDDSESSDMNHMLEIVKELHGK